MIEKMYDIQFEIGEDGSVDLEQDAGCGDVFRIHLHSAQLRLIAERAGLLDKPSPRIEKVLMASHVRRVRNLDSALAELYFNDDFSIEIGNCRSGVEITHMLQAIYDKSHDVIADLPLIEGIVEEKSAAAGEPPISVNEQSVPVRAEPQQGTLRLDSSGDSTT